MYNMYNMYIYRLYVYIFSMYIILKYVLYYIYIMYINPNVNWALVNVSRLVHKLEKKITTQCHMLVREMEGIGRSYGNSVLSA